jgi:hypothetical protein
MQSNVGGRSIAKTKKASNCLLIYISKPMAIMPHVLVYHVISCILSISYQGSYQVIQKYRHVHITCVLSQLTYCTFLRKIVVSVYLPCALAEVL